MSGPFIVPISVLQNVGANSNMLGSIPDIPDVPSMANAQNPGMQNGAASATGLVDFSGLVSSFQNTSSALTKANSAEADFASGHGNLMEMMLQRKLADTYLSVDEAVASKATQSISTLMNMQV